MENLVTAILFANAARLNEGVRSNGYSSGAETTSRAGTLSSRVWVLRSEGGG